jgi:hypothetical protein
MDLTVCSDSKQMQSGFVLAEFLDPEFDQRGTENDAVNGPNIAHNTPT